MAEIVRVIPAVRLHYLRMEESQASYFDVLDPLMQIETHMTFEERVKLYEVAMGLPQNFVACEIGSYFGASTAFLAAAATYRNGHVHAVDTWQNDAIPNEQPRDTWQEFVENTEPYRDRITAHRGKSQDVHVEVPEVDMLFLDGDHSYEGALSDLTHFMPKLKPHGVLALHDFDYESVRNAVRTYLGDRPVKDLGRADSLQLIMLM